MKPGGVEDEARGETGSKGGDVMDDGKRREGWMGESPVGRSRVQFI